MAGVKGRSGGARPNSGGKRVGAGRKKKAPPAESANPLPEPVPAAKNPIDFLLSVQNNLTVPLKDRLRAAVAAAQYVHLKRGDGGKKDEIADKAKKVSSRFTPAAPPRLIAAGGKKVR